MDKDLERKILQLDREDRERLIEKLLRLDSAERRKRVKALKQGNS